MVTSLNSSVWSKITLITGYVGRAGGIFPLVKWEKIFLYIPDTNRGEFQEFPIKWSKNILRNAVIKLVSFFSVLYV